MTGSPAERTGAGDRLGVVAAGDGDHAARSLGQGADGIGRAAQLERARALQRLALQPDGAAERRIELVAAPDRRVHDGIGDAGPRGLQISFENHVDSLAESRTRQQILLEECGNPRIAVEAVRQPRDAVALVLVAQVLDRAPRARSAATICSASLTGTRGSLAPWITISGARDAVRSCGCGEIDSRNVAVALERAVLGLAQRAAVGAGALQERHEVDDPDDVDRAAPRARGAR